jgi:hypothetical protein
VRGEMKKLLAKSIRTAEGKRIKKKFPPSVFLLAVKVKI